MHPKKRHFALSASYDSKLSIELLESRHMLSGATTNSPLNSVNGNFEQVFYLNFDGALDVSYDGPVKVSSFNVPAFSFAGSERAGVREAVISSVVSNLNTLFLTDSAHFTADRPRSDTFFSTIYIGGAGSQFQHLGSFYALAEQIDTGNSSKDDEAFVFSELLTLPANSPAEIASILVEIVGHEALHLLGHSHQVTMDSIADLAYAQGGDTVGNLNDNAIAHQWVTDQSYRLFRDQFGITEFDSFVGSELRPTRLINGQNNRYIEGAFDEDVDFENPWNQGGGFLSSDHPSTRHFWEHAADFSREFDEGISAITSTYDSAANRAIKFFTGGWDLTSETLDSEWGSSNRAGNIATPGGGIPTVYRENKGQAYYWLGHVAHLLQDLTVPVHSHAEGHLDRQIVPVLAEPDPDPFHEWVDGRDFRQQRGEGDDGPIASFDDIDPDRYRNWGFINSAGGVGPIAGGGTFFHSSEVRNPTQVLEQVVGAFSTFPEWEASFPSDNEIRDHARYESVQSLYALLVETAAVGAFYDAKGSGNLGQIDQGRRISGNAGSDFANFSKAELNEMANSLVPRAMRASAELIRFYYSTLIENDRGPLVEIVGLEPNDEQSPYYLPSTTLDITALASDQLNTVDSGVGKDLFRVEYRAQPEFGEWSDWMPWQSPQDFSSHFADGSAYGNVYAGLHGAVRGTTFVGSQGTKYNIRVVAENGAGFEGATEVFVQMPSNPGPLVIPGTDFNDVVDVNIDPNDPSFVLVTHNNASNVRRLRSRITNIVFRGRAGDDTFTNNTQFDLEAWGDAGRDRIFGGIGENIIHGGTGKDRIFGGPENDVLFGDGGNDIIRGDAGDDRIVGGNGRDRLFGEEGEDTILGGGGRDVIEGGEGADVIRGGKRGDVIRGQRGADDIEGGSGNDRIFGGNGADTIQGGSGDDRIEGEDGEDIINAGRGDDKIFGGDNNDQIQGGDGNDIIFGERGADLILGGSGNDELDGGDDNDEIYGQEGNDILHGGEGNDKLFGVEGNNRLFGEGGEDQLGGGTGNDRLEGGDDDDILLGAGGDDDLFGNDGDDVLHGLDGEDELDGGSGDDFLMGDDLSSDEPLHAFKDILRGGSGKDTLLGNGGNDELYGDGDDDNLFGGSGQDVIEGGDGNDIIVGDFQTSKVPGDASRDVIRGGSGNDRISGDGGNDDISGDAGDDVIEGKEGDDVLRGGDDNDTLWGGSGNDSFDGGSGRNIYAFEDGVIGNDTITSTSSDNLLDFREVRGGIRVDIQRTSRQTVRNERHSLLINSAHTIVDVLGTSFGDVIYGNSRSNQIEGGGGSDYLRGRDGNDTLVGESGNDELWGDAGNDELFGQDNDDELYGGTGNDRMFGGSGDDFIRAYFGVDLVNFGTGTDRGHIDGEGDQVFGDGDDDPGYGCSPEECHPVDDDRGPTAALISNQPIVAALRIADNVTLNKSILKIRGDSGRDSVTASYLGSGVVIDVNGVSHQFDVDDISHIVFRGRGGDDRFVNRTFVPSTAFGGDGDDMLVGGTGDDDLDGGPGNDLIRGNKGDDLIQGGRGNDQLSGNSGDDLVRGDHGNDRIEGGLGTDVLVGGFGDDYIDAKDEVDNGDIVIDSKGTNTILEDPPTPDFTNDAPVAEDDLIVTDAGQSSDIDLLFNDDDPDEDELYVVSVSQPQSGTVSLIDPSRPGLYRYTPAPGFVGRDSFTYLITDDEGGTATAKVDVRVRGTTVSNSPELLRPTDNRIGTRVKPEFEWSNLKNATSYELILYRDTADNEVRRIEIPKSNGPTTSYRIPEDRELRSDRSYWWAVRGISSSGQPGPRSDKWAFKTRLIRPEKSPSLAAPANGREDAQRTPRFEWSNVPRAESYVLQLYVDSPNNRVRGREYIVDASGGNSTSMSIPNDDPLRSDRQYFWDVTPVNSAGLGPASEKWTFHTRLVAPSAAPTLVRPADERQDAQRTPTFEWDNVARADTYVLQLYVDNPNNPVGNRRYEIAKESGDTTSFSIPSSDPLRSDRQYFWDVTPVNSVDSGPVSAKWEFRTRLTAPASGPELVGPVNGRHDAQRTPSFVWNNVARATSYILQLYVDNPDKAVGNRQYEISRESGDTTSFSIPNDDPLRSDRQYYWDVTPVNSAGSGPASAKWAFRTRLTAPSVAPTLVRPADGRQDAQRTPTFEWNNVARATTYVLQLYVDNPNNPVGNRRYEVSEGSGDTSSFSIPNDDPLRSDRQYYWDVTPENSAGSGPASSKWGFRTRLVAPEVAPTLVRPADGRIDTQRTPTFEWDNVARAGSYVLQLYVDNPNNPVGNRRYEVSESGGATTTFSIPNNDPLRSDRQYFWDVVPVNSIGSGPASEKWAFRTRLVAPEVTPTLVRPADGRIDAQRTPTFEWNNVARATTYVLQLYADNPNNPVGNRRYEVSEESGDTTSFSIPNDDPLRSDRQYYWDVTPVNSAGSGPASAKWAFRTRLTAPSVAPTLVRPADGRQDAQRTPTFEWNNVARATTYVLQLYVDNPNNPVGNRRYEVSEGSGDTSSFSIPNDDPLRSDRQYYWDVTPENSAGSGPASSKWGFRTRLVAPEVAPTLVRPADGRIDTQRTPTFEWDNVARAGSYVLQLYVDNPNNPVGNRRYEVSEGSGGTTSFSIPGNDPLRSDRQYYWDVVPVNSIGSGPASAKWAFRTRLVAPEVAPTLVRPADGRDNVRRSPTFEWNNVARATTYILQLYVDNPNNPVGNRRYVIPSGSGATTVFSVPDDAPLRRDRQYYWDVVPENVSGSGPVSTKWGFVTRDVAAASAGVVPITWPAAEQLATDAQTTSLAQELESADQSSRLVRIKLRSPQPTERQWANSTNPASAAKSDAEEPLSVLVDLAFEDLEEEATWDFMSRAVLTAERLRPTS